MAKSDLHRKDTENTIQETTDRKNIDLIVDVVDFCIDGNFHGKDDLKNFMGKSITMPLPIKQLNSILNSLKIYGINEDSLINDLGDVDKSGIYNGTYCGKMHFLYNWLIPVGPFDHKHRYTHKGADYVYDKKEEDENDWSGKEKHQSWLVKRKLMVDTIKNIYSISQPDAEKIAMTLYSIHRLRDLQFNGNTENPPIKEYYLNIVDDLKKYTLPLIKSGDSLKNFSGKIDKLKIELEHTNATRDWSGLLSIIETLLGSEENAWVGGGGEILPVIPEFLK